VIKDEFDSPWTFHPSRYEFIRMVYGYGFLPVFRPDGKIQVFRCDNSPGYYEFRATEERLREIVSSPKDFIAELADYFTELDLKILS